MTYGCAIPFSENLQEISKNIPEGLQVGFKPRISSAAIHRASSSFNRSSYWYRSTYWSDKRICARPATWELTMSEKDNSVPLFSPFEIERQARIKRSLVIQSCVRSTRKYHGTWGIGVCLVRSVVP
jgi:hypothetical protein